MKSCLFWSDRAQFLWTLDVMTIVSRDMPRAAVDVRVRHYALNVHGPMNPA